MKYLHLKTSDDLPDLSVLRPYKAVVILESTISPKRRRRISRSLVASGCLYMMAWGNDCAAWEESVKTANRAAFDTPEIPDRSLIITTSHDDETMSDVFWFAKYTAMHPCCTLDNTVLLHLSGSENEREYCARYAAT